jgi:hypothetical protein
MREAVGRFWRCHLQIMRSPVFTASPSLRLRLNSATCPPLIAKHHRVFSSDISRDAQSPWQSWDQALRVLIPKEDISRAIMISNTPKFAIEEDFKLL